MARSRGTDPSQQVQAQHSQAEHTQAQQAYEQAQLRLAHQQVQNGLPQHPGQSQLPPFAPQAPTPKKNFFVRHKILTALLVIVGLVIVSQMASGGDTPATTPGAGAASTAPVAPAEDVPAAPADVAPAAPADVAPAAPGIGSMVADGKFEFTVTSLEPGGTHIGDATFGVDAQGQFLLVHVTVTNAGDQAQYFDSSSQKLLDAQGRTHSADATAAIYLPDSNSFLTSINPGNTVEGIVVFDIPADATPASLELHDSPFSGGVTVALS